VVRLQGTEESGVEAKQIQVRTLLLSIAAVALVEAGAVLSKSASSPLLRLGAARLLELGFMVWIVHVVEGSVASMCLDCTRWFAGLRRGLLWSAGFGALSGIVFFALFIAGINPLALIRTSLPKSSADLSLYFLVGGILAPVTEEVFFRGILYGFLRRWGIAVALVLSTSAFALTHGLGHGFPLTQVVGGILFAAAYEIEKNLLVPITMHCLGNLAIFALSALFGN
jgi:membrane protease YdiL (CAAX protease family)